MSEKIVEIKLNTIVDDTGAITTINELKKAINDLQSDSDKLELGSEAFEKSKKQIDSLKSKLEQLGKSQRQLDEEIGRSAEEASAKRAERMEKVGNDLAKFAAGVTDAFAGAFIAFGAGEEDAKKFNETLQQGVGIAIGVKGAIEALTAGVQLAGPAFQAFNTIMAANPIGVVVVAVAALAAGIYLLVKALKEEEIQSNAVSDAVERNRQAHIENEKVLAELDRARRLRLGEITKQGAETEKMQQKNREEITANIKKHQEDISKLETDYAKYRFTRNQKEVQIASDIDARTGEDRNELLRKRTEREFKNFQAALKGLNDEFSKANKETAAKNLEIATEEIAKLDEADKEALQKKYTDNLAAQEKLRIELADGREKELLQQKSTYKEQLKTAAGNAELRKEVEGDNRLKISDINYKWDKLEKEANDKKNAEIEAADQAAYDYLGTLIVDKNEDEAEKIAAANAKKLALSLEYYEAQRKLDEAAEAKRKKQIVDVEKVLEESLIAGFNRMGTAAGELGSGIISSIGSAFKVINDEASSKIQKITAGLDALGSMLGSIASYNAQVADEKVTQNEKELEDLITNLDAQKEAELSKEGLTADQKIEIENKYAQQQYALKLAEYKNNTDIKKKAFEQDKKLKIAQAVISTITGVVSAVTGMISAVPGPVGIVLGVLAGAAVAAMGAIQIAQINKQKFDAGAPPAPPTLQVPTGPGGGAGGEGGAGQQGPQLYAAGAGDTGTAGGGQGFRSAAPPPQKVYVVSQEVTSSQNMDAVIERRSSF
jgi:hypothetical protein